MTSTFELIPPGGALVDPKAMPIEWRSGTVTNGLTTTLSWDLEDLGTQQQAVADFLRIAVAAFVADRSVARGSLSWSRDIKLRVPVGDVALWTGRAGELLVDLLWWISGDRWELQPLPGGEFAPATLELGQPQHAMLLSGGLDSLCGAVLADKDAPLHHVGHRGAETAAVAAQNRVYDWVLERYDTRTATRVRLAVRQSPEKTSRSRSLMFMALGVAAAARHGVLLVPENGFTSVNLALRPGRGGTCSTRSTHPFTFRQVNAVLAEAGIPVTVRNPHEHMTKGEMVAAAARETDFACIAAGSLSCSKLDGARYSGGNPNQHCGLCVACLVRRAAFIASEVADATDYLVNTLHGAPLIDLVHRRRLDLDAVRAATLTIPEESQISHTLMASASWRNDDERRAAAVVYRRGLEELSHVPLP